MENKFGFNFSEFLISIFFFTHIFVLERYKNGFVEYEFHFIITILTIVLSHMFIFRKRLPVLFLKIDISLLFTITFLIYCILSMIIHESIDIKYIVYIVILYLTFNIFSNCKTHNLINNFFIINIVIVIIDVSNIQIINNIYFVNDTPKINSGQNSCYYASIIPFTFSILLKKIRQKEYSIDIVIPVLLLLSLFFIIFIYNSRTSYLAASIGMLFVLKKDILIGIKFIYAKKKIFSIFCAIFLIIFVYFISIKIIHHDTNSIDGRFFIYEICIFLFLAKPILGFGPQSFAREFNLFQSSYINKNNIHTDTLLLADNNYYAFNEILHILVEFGIIGFIIILTFIFLFFKNFKYDTTIYYIQLGALASLICILLCAQSSYPLHTISLVINALFFLSILSRKPIILINIKLTRLKRSFFIIILVTALNYLNIRYLLAYKNWEKASAIALSDNPEESLLLFNKSFQTLYNNGNFLLMYGAVMFNLKKDYRSIILFEKSSKYYASTNLYLYMGENYDSLNCFKKSKESYQIAINMHPARYIAKFHLLLLLNKYHKYDEAKHVAYDIINFPIKIPSTEVYYYKRYAKEYVDKVNNSSNE